LLAGFGCCIRALALLIVLAFRPNSRQEAGVVRNWSLLAGALTLLTGRSALAQLPPPGSPDDRPLVPVSAPSEAYPSPGTRGRLALTGLGVFGVWYGAAVAQSFGWREAPGHEKLLIPVVGPWLTISQAGCGNEVDCTSVLVVVRSIISGITSVGQLGGLAILGEAAFMRTEQPQPKRSSQSAVSIRSVSVVPGRDSWSLGVSGAF
jgi:hypothetical protein